MKNWLVRNGRFIAGLNGIASAIAFWFDFKELGAAFSVCALVLAISAGLAVKK